MVAQKRFRASFTLIELLAAMAILAIIASMAVVGYRGYLDEAAMLQDETNMMILEAAVKINAIQTGTVAGTISDLRPSDLERAYALVSQGKRPYTLLAYAGESWRSLFWGESVAEADEFLPSEYYHRDLKVVTCPKDPSKPTGFDADGRPNGSSYAIHKKLKGKPIRDLLRSPPDRVLIYESDGGKKEVYRHRGQEEAVRVTIAGKAIRRKHGDDNPDPPDQEDI